MNINEQMHQLGQLGSVGYAPSDDVVDELLSRTHRARVTRQGSAALVGSVSAVSLGVAGANVFFGDEDEEDPAFRDRNLIEDSTLGLNLSFEDKYSDDYTGRDEATKEKIDQIYEDLMAAAQAEAEALEQKRKEEEQRQAEQDKQDQQDTTTKEEPKDDPPACEDDYDSYDYKWYDCSKDKWRIKDGWIQDPWDDTWTECVDGKAAEHSVGYYSCSENRWVLDTGYFEFGNDEIYKCESWTDKATGTTFTGAISNNPVSGSFNGTWPNKRIYCDPDKTYTSTVNSYLYIDGLVSWSGNTCTGKVKGYKGADHRVSCRNKDELLTKYGEFEWNNGSNHPWTKNNGDRLILLDSGTYKWFKYSWFIDSKSDYGYKNKNTVVEYDGRTFEWNGSKWIETTPEPTASPTASSAP